MLGSGETKWSIDYWGLLLTLVFFVSFFSDGFILPHQLVHTVSLEYIPINVYIYMYIQIYYNIYIYIYITKVGLLGVYPT